MKGEERKIMSNFTAFPRPIVLSRPEKHIALGAELDRAQVDDGTMVRGYLLCVDQKDGALKWVLAKSAQISHFAGSEFDHTPNP
jgi:hypothetical protein